MTSLNRFSVIALLISAATVTGGCASAGTSFTSQRHAASQPIALSVRNNNWADVKIYYVPDHGGRPIRLTAVESFTSRTIPLRGQAKAAVLRSGAARFLIQPIGSRRIYTTHRLIVRPGDGIQLTVENQLTSSTLTPYNR